MVERIGGKGQVTGRCPSITRNASIPQRMMTNRANTPSRNIIAKRFYQRILGRIAGQNCFRKVKKINEKLQVCPLE